MEHTLIGCIDRIDVIGDIRTRFFHVSMEEGKVKDVTKNLVESIDNYNNHASMIDKLGIPYEYKGGLACYSFGCGLSHYLQEDTFQDINKASIDVLEFPIEKCRLVMYAPSDVKDLLECKGAFDKNIKAALKEHYTN